MDVDWIKAMQLITATGGNCTTEVKHMDDETGDDCLPLPGSKEREPAARGKKCGDARLGAHRVRPPAALKGAGR